MERRSVDRLSQDVSHQGYDIEQHITVASSPSIILDGIERYIVISAGEFHYLIVPLREVGMPGTLARERRVTVELKRYPSSSAEENRLEFRWFPAGETVPSFIGTFAVRPQGAGHAARPVRSLPAAIRGVHPRIRRCIRQRNGSRYWSPLTRGAQSRPRDGNRRT